MVLIITSTLVMAVLKAALGFNIDPVAWKSLRNSAAGFGHQVVQRQSDLLVSAPLEQYETNRRGQIFQCTTRDCKPLQLQAPAFAVNMSLGLTMTTDPDTGNTMVCGPTIPKDCKSITMYSGLCFQLDPGNTFGPSVPSSIMDCPVQADIAFVLDGSGSVARDDFQTMKNFVKTLVRSFLSADMQFSLVQFSSTTTFHYYFDNFFQSGNWEWNIDHAVSQKRGGTRTANAISNVVNQVFIPSRGSREGVKRVMVVITDGQSTDPAYLPYAINLSEQANIVRFAIGVGSAFNDKDAITELNTIASHPSRDFVFRVDNFNALQKIQDILKDRIFSIEGSQSAGVSLKMELSQEGFRAAYVPGGVQLATVGANQWKGGYIRYTQGGEKKDPYEPATMEPDSYLGYSMAIAKINWDTLTIVGAPRYEHRGIVMAVHRRNNVQKIDPHPWQFQIGEYFGAEVSAMDTDLDGNTDLILISAPMYSESDREGRVYVCGMTGLKVECHFDSPSVLRGDAFESGRFGTSLAVLPDLNTDGHSDLAIGAPLENDGQGSVYIFHSDGLKRISSTYSQRIAGSQVERGLKFFGMSISPVSFDQSRDRLPDLAVGSKGTVILLRSRPIVMVEAEVSFSPNQIPTQNVDCSKPLEISAVICLTMSRHSVVDAAQARIIYTMKLDATRSVPNNRAYITDKEREETQTIDIGLERQRCSPMTFFTEPCPDDALNELQNELRFSFEGLASGQNPKPILAQQAQTTTFHPITFEINCGTDNMCIDNLNLDFNFTGSSDIRVGIDELLEVTVAVKNTGENSYNGRVILTYPAGLSYRKFTSLRGRIQCNSVDSESFSEGKTDCTIDKPIFKTNTEAFFIVSYGIEADSQLDRRVFISANASSGNQRHASSMERNKTKHIDVKYSIFVTLESPLSYTNFSYGKSDLQKAVNQSVKVTNDIRALNFTVMIKVPVKLGDKNIWANLSSLQIPGCQDDADEEPVIRDFVPAIKKSKVVDCSVAWCRTFRCTTFMGRLESETYKMSANISSDWIEQIELKSAKFLLISTAMLDYDRNRYIFYSTGSNNNPPVHKIEVEVEVYPEPDFTVEIIGGTLGGLAFLVLLTAVLYKAGFFKSKYKEMINAEGALDADQGPESAPAPE